MLIGLIGLSAATSSPAITTIASTIQSVEGYYPGTLAYTNNNPGNLIYVGQSGATPGAGGFAAFPSYAAGYQALLNQIQSYSNSGLTIEQMMEKYAPLTDNNGNPTGNNPQLYASKIAAALGVSTDTTLSDAIAGNATAGIPPVDSSAVFGSSSDDPVTTALTDLGNAISSGDFSQVSGTDWAVVVSGVALVLLGGWVIAR